MTKNIKVILGSTRTNRAGEKVAHWAMNQLNRVQGDLKFELFDLAEIDLPFMDEPVSPMTSDAYKHDHTKSWSTMINQADGFIFITPEYNHGYPGVLKNAIDFLYKEWKGKPAGIVGYGSSGARNSIRQLREVLIFIGMKPIEKTLGVSHIWEAFDEKSDIKSEFVTGTVDDLVAQLQQELKN